MNYTIKNETNEIKTKEKFKLEKPEDFNKYSIKKLEENNKMRIIYTNEEKRNNFKTIRRKYETKDENDDKKCVHEKNLKTERSKSQIVRNKLILIKPKEKKECDNYKNIDPKQIVNDDGGSTLNYQASEEPLVQMNDNRYKCAHCAYSSSLKRGLIEHMMTHFNKGLFACAHCSYRAARKTTLQKHIFNRHFSKNFNSSGKRDCDKRYQCVSCDASYKHQYSLIKHIRQHSEIGLEVSKRCKTCDFSSPNPFILKNHLLTHSMKKFKCDHCEGVFSRSDVLNRHRVLYHTSYGLFKCASCLRKYTTKAGLEKHQLQTCAGNCLSPHFKCTVCEKTFTYEFQLTNHKVKHTRQYPFKCSVCTKGFSAYTLLRNHIYSHSKESLFKCTFCNFTTDHENMMAAHKDNHHRYSNYSCADCDFVAKKGDVWLKHQEKHKTVQKLYCAHCEYSTNNRSSLILHLQWHSMQ